MAVHVFLSFEDDDDAKEFVKGVMEERTTTWFYDEHELDPLPVHATIEAVYKKPVKFCQCTGRRSGWTRGRKFGWWVCADCSMPTERWASNNAWFGFMGTNLLPTEIADEYRPKGWEHSPYEWGFLIPKNPTGQLTEPMIEAQLP